MQSFPVGDTSQPESSDIIYLALFIRSSNAHPPASLLPRRARDTQKALSYRDEGIIQTCNICRRKPKPHLPEHNPPFHPYLKQPNMLLQLSFTLLLASLNVLASPVVIRDSPITLPFARRFNTTGTTRLLELEQARARALRDRPRTAPAGLQGTKLPPSAAFSIPASNQIVDYVVSVSLYFKIYLLYTWLLSDCFVFESVGWCWESTHSM